MNILSKTSTSLFDLTCHRKKENFELFNFVSIEVVLIDEVCLLSIQGNSLHAQLFKSGHDFEFYCLKKKISFCFYSHMTSY